MNGRTNGATLGLALDLVIKKSFGRLKRRQQFHHTVGTHTLFWCWSSNSNLCFRAVSSVWRAIISHRTKRYLAPGHLTVVLTSFRDIPAGLPGQLVCFELAVGMVAPRRKDLIRSRRRIEDDGEEEDGSVIAGAEDDSLSEASLISNEDDDADAEGSDGSEAASPEQRDPKPKAASNIRSPATQKRKQGITSSPVKPSLNRITADTELMMNGLRFSGDVDEGEEVNFEDLGHDYKAAPEHTTPFKQSSVDPSTTFGERRRREHEEYKKKRDADPAFVPNRGGFFMHDHRSAAPGQNGFKPFGRGRGRGRGELPGPPYPAR